MTDLTPEQRQQIYEEEKARAEAQVKVAEEKKEADEKASQAKIQKGCLGCLAAVILAPVVFIYLWVTFFPGDPPSPREQAESRGTMAAIQCESFVRDRLTAPATADFPFLDREVRILGDNVNYMVTSYVDSENAFGATLRTNWICEIRYNGGEDADRSNWTLVNLETD